MNWATCNRILYIQSYYTKHSNVVYSWLPRCIHSFLCRRLLATRSAKLTTMAVKKLQLLILFWTYFAVTYTSKVLLIPRPINSQIATFRSVGDALIDRGHEVHLLISSSYSEIDIIEEESQNLKLITYDYDIRDQGEGFKWTNISVSEYLTQDPHNYVDFCKTLLNSKSLEETIDSAQYDISLIDGHEHFRCMYAFVYRASLEYITYMDHDTDLTFIQKTGLQSTCTSTSYMEPNDSFRKRLGDFLGNLAQYFSGSSQFAEMDNILSEFVPNKEKVTSEQLLRDSSLILINSDKVLSKAKARLSNMIDVGGVAVRLAGPLADDLERFMNFLPGGVVVVSINDDYQDIPNEVLQKLLEAFKLIRYPVIWQTRLFTNEEVTPRIQMMEWINQNDLLGHTKTQLFITEGDTNNQFQALFHAVPMLLLPITPEQKCLASRAESKGYGTVQDIANIDSDYFAKMIEEMIKNQTHKDLLSTASKMYRENEFHPFDRAVYWINHILRYGGDHFKSELHGSLHQYMMLDVIGFLCTLIFLVWNAILLIFLFVFANHRNERSKKVKTVPAPKENGTNTTKRTSNTASPKSKKASKKSDKDD